MEREELLKSPEFWIVEIQMNFYEKLNEYMKTNNISRKQLADKLGFSKSYITQILNGDFDHRISKFVKIAMSIGIIPRIEYSTINDVLFDDKYDGLYLSSNERPSFLIENSQITLKIQTSKKSEIKAENTIKYSQNIPDSDSNNSNLHDMKLFKFNSLTESKYEKEKIFA